jgi:hypothetical protein
MTESMCMCVCVCVYASVTEISVHWMCQCFSAHSTEVIGVFSKHWHQCNRCLLSVSVGDVDVSISVFPLKLHIPSLKEWRRLTTKTTTTTTSTSILELTNATTIIAIVHSYPHSHSLTSVHILTFTDQVLLYNS